MVWITPKSDTFSGYAFFTVSRWFSTIHKNKSLIFHDAGYFLQFVVTGNAYFSCSLFEYCSIILGTPLLPLISKTILCILFPCKSDGSKKVTCVI